MIKFHIIAPVVQFTAPFHHFVFHYVIHPLARHIGADDGSQIGERIYHGVIQPRHHQQKHEESDHIECALGKIDTAEQCRGGNAHFQQHLGRYHKRRHAIFVHHCNALHTFYLFCKLLCSFRLAVGRFYLPDGLYALLNAIGHCHLAGTLPFVQPVYYRRRQGHNHKAYGQRPQGSACHAPVEKEQRHRHQHRGHYGAEKLWNKMRRGCLYIGAVVHYGGSEVCQILMSEKAERQAPQPLGQCYTPHPALHIGGVICPLVLVVIGQCYQQQAHRYAGAIEHRIQLPVRNQVRDKIEQQPHWQHQREVLEHTGHATFYHIFCPLV